LTTALSLGNTPSGRPHPTAEIRLIRGLFRLICQSPSSLTDEDARNYMHISMVNVIGLFPVPLVNIRIGFRPTPFHTADEVFAGAASEREAALAWVRNHADADWKKPVLDWLTVKSGK
jgi:hypothetical protein